MRDDNVLKAAAGLSGGVGGMQDVCGALLGSSIALGMKYGRERQELDNLEIMPEALAPVGRLYKWFEKEYGTVKCRELRTKFGGGIYYDMNVPWQKEMAEEAGVAQGCVDLVGRTASRAAELILEPPQTTEEK